MFPELQYGSLIISSVTTALMLVLCLRSPKTPRVVGCLGITVGFIGVIASALLVRYFWPFAILAASITFIIIRLKNKDDYLPSPEMDESARNAFGMSVKTAQFTYCITQRCLLLSISFWLQYSTVLSKIPPSAVHLFSSTNN